MLRLQQKINNELGVEQAGFREFTLNTELNEHTAKALNS